MITTPETVADVLAHIRSSPVPSINEKNEWADRIESALASAEPVAWSRTDDITDDDGCPIGTDEPRVVWGSEHPDPSETWFPLYGGPMPATRDAQPAAQVEAAARDVKSIYSDQDVLNEVRAMVIMCFESQAAFAKSRNISPAYVSDVLNGRRAMPEQWAVLAGFSRPKWFRDTPKRWTDISTTEAPTPVSVPDGCKAMHEALLAVRTSVRFKTLSKGQQKLIDFALNTTPEPRA